MFTGIVEAKGKVVSLANGKKKSVLTLSLPVRIRKGLKKGDSLAVQGVCLTVCALRGKNASFDLLDETLRCTDLGSLGRGMQVNLERALRKGSRMGGHDVSGHVDVAGELVRVEQRKADRIFTVKYPLKFAKLLVEKGSIAMDGVSLTVVGVEKNTFRVHLIPHTLSATTLGTAQAGDLVNLEFDLRAKWFLEYKDATR